MIELHHGNEPESLARYRRDHSGSPWDSPEFHPVREEIRHALHTEQEGLCVYCEQKVDRDGGHLEHIKPRSSHPRLTYDYGNMAHSCNGRNHCGHYKKNLEIPIEPRPGCNDFFEVMFSDGKLVPAENLADHRQRQAETTLSVLGLNSPALARQRQQYAASLRFLANEQEQHDFLRTAPFRHCLKS